MGETSNKWYYVQLTDGTTGFVMSQYVTPTGGSASASYASTEPFIVGEAGNGYNIYSWLAPNGQTLYFTSRDEPGIKMEDVNFDGKDDVVITIIRGASNFFSEFFIWFNDEYLYADHPGEECGICNYQLYPEYRIVCSDMNNGYAGSLHEKVLFQWEGSKLEPVRRAVSETYCVMNDTSDGYSLTYHTETLHVRVWDYTKAEYEGELIYDTLIDLDSLSTSEDHHLAFADEQKAIWQGIK